MNKELNMFITEKIKFFFTMLSKYAKIIHGINKVSLIRCRDIGKIVFRKGIIRSCLFLRGQDLF